MTTKVTVDAHAGWPVKVEAIDQYPGDAEPVTRELGIVQPGEVRDFHVFDARKIVITELKKDAAQ